MIRVLVVEDERSIARNTCNVIESINSEFQVVRIAYNGKQAIETLNDESIDVAFLDINMPILSGLKVLEYIYVEKLPVVSVMLTACQDFSYAQNAIRYKAFDYLLKPLKREQMEETLLKLQLQLEKVKKESMLFRHKVMPYEQLSNTTRLGSHCYFGMIYLGCCGDETNEENQNEQIQIENELIRLLNRQIGERNYWLIKGKTSSERLLFVEENQSMLQENLGCILEELGDEIPITIGVTYEKIGINEIKDVGQQIQLDLPHCMFIHQSTLACFPLEIDYESKEKNKVKVEKIITKITEDTSVAEMKRGIQRIFDYADGELEQIEYGMLGFFEKICAIAMMEYTYDMLECKVVSILQSSYNEDTLLERYHIMIQRILDEKII